MKQSTYALRQALAGHHGPLNGRIQRGAVLTQDERDYVTDKLQALDRKPGKAALKRVTSDLIAEHVEAVAKESGSTEAAVDVVAKHIGRKRSTVFEAMKRSNGSESKKRK